MDEVFAINNRLQKLLKQQRELLEKMSARLDGQSEKGSDELHNSTTDASSVKVCGDGRNGTP